MAKNGNGRATDKSLMSGVRRIHGTAAPQPNQGKRTADSGNGSTCAIAGRGTMEKK